jgi:hypothetical protein
MARELQPIDVSTIPDLLRVAEEVHTSKEARLLKRNDEDLAVIVPISPGAHAGRKSGIVTRDDALFRMIGSGRSGIPGGISGRKYDYFRRAFGAEERRP